MNNTTALNIWITSAVFIDVVNQAALQAAITDSVKLRLTGTDALLNALSVLDKRNVTIDCTDAVFDATGVPGGSFKGGIVATSLENPTVYDGAPLETKVSGQILANVTRSVTMVDDENFRSVSPGDEFALLPGVNKFDPAEAQHVLYGVCESFEITTPEVPEVPGTPGTISVVTSHVENFNNGSGGTTSGIDTTGATLLIVVVGGYNGAGDATLGSDSKSNSGWSRLGPVQHSGTSNLTSLYWKRNPTVGSGHTFTVSGAGCNVAILALSSTTGWDTNPVVGSTGGATNAGTNSAQPGSVSADGNNNISVTILCNQGETFGVSGYTTLTANHVQFQSQQGGGLAYKILTTPSAQNPTWTWNSNADDINGGVGIVVFKPATTGGTPAVPAVYTLTAVEPLSTVDIRTWSDATTFKATLATDLAAKVHASGIWGQVSDTFYRGLGYDHGLVLPSSAPRRFADNIKIRGNFTFEMPNLNDYTTAPTACMGWHFYWVKRVFVENINSTNVLGAFYFAEGCGSVTETNCSASGVAAARQADAGYIAAPFAPIWGLAGAYTSVGFVNLCKQLAHVNIERGIGSASIRNFTFANSFDDTGRVNSVSLWGFACEVADHITLGDGSIELDITGEIPALFTGTSPLCDGTISFPHGYNDVYLDFVVLTPYIIAFDDEVYGPPTAYDQTFSLPSNNGGSSQRALPNGLLLDLAATITSVGGISAWNDGYGSLGAVVLNMPTVLTNYEHIQPGPSGNGSYSDLLTKLNLGFDWTSTGNGSVRISGIYMPRQS